MNSYINCYVSFNLKIMIIFKSTIYICAILGLVILLGQNLGWFINKDRVEFLNTISEQRESSPDTNV